MAKPSQAGTRPGVQKFHFRRLGRVPAGDVTQRMCCVSAGMTEFRATRSLPASPDSSGTAGPAMLIRGRSRDRRGASGVPNERERSRVGATSRFSGASVAHLQPRHASSLARENKRFGLRETLSTPSTRPRWRACTPSCLGTGPIQASAQRLLKLARSGQRASLRSFC